jgi:hypothetical protein
LIKRNISLGIRESDPFIFLSFFPSSLDTSLF